MKHPFSQWIPPWTDGRNQRNLFLVCSGGALVFSLAFYLSRLDMARSGLYYTGIEGEVHRLYAGIKMPYFADLVSSQGYVSNFSSPPAFFPLVLLILGAAVLAVYNYAKLWQGAKSIYLMGRLPDRWELHRRCLTLPLLMILTALVLMALLLPAYYGLYLLATPETCLRPGQLARLQALFHGLFLPTPHPGWG